MVLGLLTSLCLAYVYAVGNIALVVGLTPKDIALHYYGDQKSETKPQVAAGEQEFNLDDVQTPKEIHLAPSFKSLVQEGHFHLFGMTTFFFILTFLALFTNLEDKAKILLVGTPFLAVILDNLSFMATRFLGPHFAYFTAISGALVGGCFTALIVVIGFEVTKKKEAS